MAAEVIMIEPDITPEENERRWQAVQVVLKKVAKEMQRTEKIMVKK